MDGCLPLLGIDLTDYVLESLFDIIAHVPLPEADPNQRVPTDPDALLKVRLSPITPSPSKALFIVKLFLFIHTRSMTTFAPFVIIYLKLSFTVIMLSIVV